ncbi:MAG: trehalose-phosphatase [Solirubrobacterales bacterium]|nr:trehalose-phosphatase [Solirubrobacterales bacterium]
MHGTGSSGERWREELAPLLEDPASSAVLSDLDGTLAPIVARPELVAVPARARSALERIAARYGLCAVVTGRQPENAREIVGLGELAYAGNHGFELLEPGASRSVPSPELAGREDAAAGFLADAADRGAMAKVGVRLEDKGPIVALHWRGAEDEEAAERVALRIGEDARGRGLRTHAGRKVLELRPPADVDKGIAIAGLLGRAGTRYALFAGDDLTDLDGFRALAEMRQAGELDAIVRVGVRSPEGPAEIISEADVVVADTEELADLLTVLAEG